MADKQLAKLVIDIEARTNKLEQQLKSIESQGLSSGKKIEGMFSSFGSKITAAIGGVLAFQKVLDFAIEAKNAARDADEIRSKFDTVFSSLKNNANEVAENFSRNFGLAGTTTRELLANTGDLLVGFGFSEQAALDLSNKVNSLAQDLTSFSNFAGGAKGASEALTKALLGETDSAKSLGIVIRQGTKEFDNQVASTMKSQHLTETQARAVVILNEAYKQSGKAIGDYQRTKDSLANTERRINEELKNQKELIGREINNTYRSFLELAVLMSKNFGQMQGSISAFGIVLKSLATPLVMVATWLKIVGTAWGTLAATFLAFSKQDYAGAANIAKNGFGLVVQDVKNAGQVIMQMWKKTEEEVSKVNLTPQSTSANGTSGTKSKEELDKQKDIIKSFYSEMKLMTLAYYKFQMDEIKKSSDEFKKAGIKDVEIEAWKQQKLMSIYMDRPVPAKTKLEKTGFKTLTEQVQEGKAQFIMTPVAVPQNPAFTPEKREEVQREWEQQNEFLVSSMQGALNIIGSGFSDLWNGIFGQANSIFEKIAAMMAEKLAVKGLVSLISLIPGVGPWLGTALGGHTGGYFSNSGGGVHRIPSFAAGTNSFIVPPGFSNDRFPLMVESGERVRVTSSQKTRTEQSELTSQGTTMRQVLSRLDVMNMNLLTSGQRTSCMQVDIEGRTDGRDIYYTNKRAEKKYKIKR
mgnify:CR=1 FL=1